MAREPHNLAAISSVVGAARAAAKTAAARAMLDDIASTIDLAKTSAAMRRRT